MTDVEYNDHMFEYGSEDSKRIYLNGILDFLKVIGPSQSKLIFFSLPDGVDPFKALDKVGSRIKEMNFQHCEGGTTLQYLSRSNQGKCIERLTLDTKMDSVHPLKNMTALTILALFSSDDLPVHLADYLDACPPALKTLTISGKHLVAPPFKRSLDSIETLCISYRTMTGDIGDILSSCFLNLVELIFTGTIIENTNIMLNSLRFQKAIFTCRTTIPSKAFRLCLQT
jgi:hypothetical protein